MNKMDADASVDVTKQRKRAANWEIGEKILLKETLTSFVSVIENKDTRTNSNNAKTAAWKQVHARFLELNIRERSLEELKQQWRCIKLEAKKEISKYTTSMNQTGGGPKPPSPSLESQEIVSLVPNEFSIDSNKFDSDGALNIEVVGDCLVIKDDSNDITSIPPSEPLYTPQKSQSIGETGSRAESSKRTLKRKRLATVQNTSDSIEDMAKDRTAAIKSKIEMECAILKEKWDLEKIIMLEKWELEKKLMEGKLENIELRKKILEKDL